MNNTGTVGREPRFQLVKRVEMTRAETFLLNLYAILIAIVAGGILIACIGINPVSFYGTVISGCFRTALSIKSLIRILFPCLLPRLRLSPPFA